MDDRKGVSKMIEAWILKNEKSVLENQLTNIVLYKNPSPQKNIHVIDMESYRRLEAAYYVLREACQKIGGKELESWGAMYEYICEEALQKADDMLK